MQPQALPRRRPDLRICVAVLALLGATTGSGCAAEPEVITITRKQPQGAPTDTATPAAGPTCTDKSRNGDELGTDCGGACKKCDGAECAADAECVSNLCNKTCVPPGTKLCGVGTAQPCADGGACAQDLDCASDYCNGARCVAAPPDAHGDGRRDAKETDVDCGGPAPKPCDAGKKCKVADDCVGLCTAGVCDPPSGTDGKKNGGETDIDCGGSSTKKCDTGKGCLNHTDCGFGWCTASKCGKPSATDGITNGTETDKDCGGAAVTFGGVTIPAGPGCGPAKKCGVDADCASAVCAYNKVCVEAPSCRSVHGGQTCGTGEFGQLVAVHESCCKTLDLGPDVTMVQGGVTKQVYLDKYEVTAGRIRAWVEDIKAQYAGVPNVQAWVRARMAVDPILATMFPNVTVSGMTVNMTEFLPSKATDQPFTFPYVGGGTIEVDLGLNDQLGPTSYYRGTQTGGTSGCYMGAGSYGHRTYWYSQAMSNYYSEVYRPGRQNDLDEKSMNCLNPIMFAAFCAWDGGYIQSVAALSAAYGPYQWPWGDSPNTNDEAFKYSNFNSGVGNFSATKLPRYLWPIVPFAHFANDFTPVIAAPGRFPMDLSLVREGGGGAGEGWYDLGGNMIEWSQANGAYRGWTGSSWEGHNYPRAWTGGIYFLDKYGKGSTRCMRLKG